MSVVAIEKRVCPPSQQMGHGAGSGQLEMPACEHTGKKRRTHESFDGKTLGHIHVSPAMPPLMG